MKLNHGMVNAQPAIFLYGPRERIADIVETDEGARLDVWKSDGAHPQHVHFDPDHVQAIGWFCVSQFMVDTPDVLLGRLRAALKGSLSPTSEVFGILDELEQGLRKP